MSITDNAHSEYWFHVSDQKEIPIYGAVDVDFDLELLKTIVDNLPDEEEKQKDYIKELVKDNPDVIDVLRPIVGVSDKRMYLELSYLFAKTPSGANDGLNILGKSFYEFKKHSISGFKQILRRESTSEKASNLISNYLCEKKVLDIIKSFKAIGFDQFPTLLECLILPSETQQAETKRRGHGAERELAILLKNLGVSFLPEGKEDNPMGADDPNVDKREFTLQRRDEQTTWSFDIIIQDNDGHLRCFTQGLVHTSDPGQYGVNKSAESLAIREGMDAYNESHDIPIELWGLVDGVGFIENPEKTVFKMIPVFSCFVQLKSLYKAALRLHNLGIVRVKAIRFDMDFYSIDEANAMFAKYGKEDIVCITDKTIPEGVEIQAGKAWIYV